MIGGSEAVGGTSPETWAYALHVATAFRPNQLWWDPSWLGRGGYSGRASTVESQLAAVRTVCVQQEVAIDSTSLEFPSLRECTGIERVRTKARQSRVVVVGGHGGGTGVSTPGEEEGKGGDAQDGKECSTGEEEVQLVFMMKSVVEW